MKPLFLLPAIFLFVFTACVRHLPTDETDLSTVNREKLNLIDTLLQQSIDSGWIKGAVAYISKENKTIYYRAFGVDNDQTGKKMEKDAIFRIASQTKAITSVAVMMLFEQGKLLLDDPVSKYIPEFANPKVLDTYNEKDTSYTTKPANREITIRDLLTHTSGVDYAAIGSPQMQAIYAKADIPGGLEARPVTLGEKIKKLGTLPLVHQPGEKFTYGLNVDILGYVVEVVSGVSLDEFFRENIFEPLDMKDTYFYLPTEKHDRLVSVYYEDQNHKPVNWGDQNINGFIVTYPLAKGTYYSGGAGLSSTITDYGRFLQMLLNHGEYNGRQILSRNTVKLMTINQIGDLYVGKDKFGLGFAITTQEGEAVVGQSENSFSWGGIFGTTYWVDPDQELVCLLYCQQLPISHGEIVSKFKSLIYSAIKE